jgi:uncharacterized membrane protein
MSRNHRWWLLVILLLAVVLRLSDLGGKSLWLDEAFSVWNSARAPEQIWNEVNDNHPPLYYLLLHAWMAIGDSEALVRLPSVFISMVALALTYVLGTKLFNKTVALAAAALLALAPLDLWYAQEARMVIFVIPPALLIALGLAASSWLGGLLIFLGLGLGLYLDYTIVPLWVILSGIFFVRWWREGRSARPLLIWFGASLAGWLLFLPLWSHLALVVGRMSDIFIFANLREALDLPDLGLVVVLLLLIGLGVATALGAWLLLSLYNKPAARRMLIIVTLVGFTLLTLLAPLPRLYSLKRVVVTGWPFIILFVTFLLMVQSRRRRSFLAVLITASLAATLLSLLAVPKDDWRAAVNYLNESAGAGDLVWLDPFSGNVPYNYYRPELQPQFNQDMLPDPPPVDIWHIAERQHGKPVPASAAERWLDANRKLIESIPFYRLELRHYAPSD